MENGLVPLDQEKPNQTHRWRLYGGLLVLVLCVSAAICFTLPAMKQDQVDKSNEIQHTLRQISENRKTAIHLEGYYDPTGKYNTSVEWSKDVNQGFNEGGLELKNNEVVIPRSGFYYVYTQASFQVSCKATADSEPTLVHITHRVDRWTSTIGCPTKKEYHPMLHTVRTVCESSSGSQSEGKWRSAVYMGAVFSLNKGDELKTVTSEKLLPQLDSSSGKNIFGVFAL
ncbi:hypothetical protein UPYG_G00331650 [Umbra pygmaea]|uniref:Tumor necrosis factor n=1 Tax=Umbra pygmaea TaxID=75934 RepID=A0ABD0W9S6_UMBPY